VRAAACELAMGQKCKKYMLNTLASCSCCISSQSTKLVLPCHKVYGVPVSIVRNFFLNAVLPTPPRPKAGPIRAILAATLLAYSLRTKFQRCAGELLLMSNIEGSQHAIQLEQC
jgi:hypothetical protein